MKKKLLKALTLGLSIACCAFALNVQAATTITENKTGTIDGYDYELWKDSGNTSMTLNGGGKFSCSWSNINNALFRTGKKYNETQTHQELGNITLDYACNYQPSGNSYLSVYGWTSSPLVEYYIIESWGSWRPPGAQSKGVITVDGATYDVYETTRVNQPSIKGTATFQQYWSVRTSKRTSGSISVSEHFKAWEKMGMKMGKMYEVSLVVEGYQSSGRADVTAMTINIDGGTKPEVKGDLNADGSVNALDFAALKSHLIGATKLSGTPLSNADVNGDGQVDALDFALMKKLILGVITTF
ncbi:glycoside hydrolase family 11 protein [Ruminiclostridium josui]|uniref:glycoside hydrolase family 11 protein n=1 Tax=Ruminiclostridium josui TaxID=1499 RepID=UPI0004654A50|nr:glycoside hydrolase family 11 protein [Ruminiclostridium josui]